MLPFHDCAEGHCFCFILFYLILDFGPVGKGKGMEKGKGKPKKTRRTEGMKRRIAYANGNNEENI